jgi:benzoyl-CoA reductase/2-hydroxyglutaryl-CoA dehydratase subunit BcrC/BadD/HgdB
MSSVVYSCPFVPCEWIAAHGLRPQRISPHSAAGSFAASSEGVCPYAGAFIDSACEAPSADAVVVTTICDQMRRGAELIARRCGKPVFLLNVPATWQGAEARGLYLDELRRLGRFLEAVGGRPPSETLLAWSMLACDRLRRELRAERPHLAPRRFSQLLLEVASGQEPAIARGPAPAADGIPVALLGGPLRQEDFEIFDVIEEAGGRVVLDATDSGERALPAPFDSRRVDRQPLEELADAYFGAIPHVFRRPNDALYEYLDREVPQRAARAVIFRRYAWCDLWNAELQRLKERLGVPVLELDVGGDGMDRSRWALRIQALLETLS